MTSASHPGDGATSPRRGSVTCPHHVVYHGPGLSGKHSNLVALVQLLPDAVVSALTFQDGLSLDVDRVLGAPPLGRVVLESTPSALVTDPQRTLLLQRADAYVLVLDAQVGRAAGNREAIADWRSALIAGARDPDSVAAVVQVTKLDTPSARPLEEVLADAGVARLQAVLAHPPRGEGVLETFLAVLRALARRPSSHRNEAHSDHASRRC